MSRNPVVTPDETGENRAASWDWPPAGMSTGGFMPWYPKTLPVVERPVIVSVWSPVFSIKMFSLPV